MYELIFTYTVVIGVLSSILFSIGYSIYRKFCPIVDENGKCIKTTPYEYETAFDTISKS